MTRQAHAKEKTSSIHLYNDVQSHYPVHSVIHQAQLCARRSGVRRHQQGGSSLLLLLCVSYKFSAMGGWPRARQGVEATTKNIPIGGARYFQTMFKYPLRPPTLCPGFLLRIPVTGDMSNSIVCQRHLRQSCKEPNLRNIWQHMEEYSY